METAMQQIQQLQITYQTRICTKCKNIKLLSMFNKCSRVKNGTKSVCRECNKKLELEYRTKNKDDVNKRGREWAERNKEKISTKLKKTREEKIIRHIKIDGMKFCLSCNEYHSLDLFYKRSASKDGKDNYCIKCAIQKTKQHALNNKSAIMERQRIYRQLNGEKIKNRQKKYRESTNGKIIRKNLQNKRRIKENKGDITNQQIINLEQNAKVCYWCNASLKNKKVHIDHYIPLSKGGEHTLSNLVVSCKSCNNKKHAKMPEEFANSIGRLL